MKSILKIAGFTVLLILMIGLLGYPFRGGYWYLRGYLADRDCRIAGIQEEPEGQVDVLNVGDSLADIAITPVEMYRDDHRGDAEYQSWTDILSDYEQEVRDMEGTCYPDIEKKIEEEKRPADYDRKKYGPKG